MLQRLFWRLRERGEPEISLRMRRVRRYNRFQQIDSALEFAGTRLSDRGPEAYVDQAGPRPLIGRVEFEDSFEDSDCIERRFGHACKPEPGGFVVWFECSQLSKEFARTRSIAGPRRPDPGAQ